MKGDIFMKRTIFITILFVFLLPVCAFGQLAQPNVINYQGVLRDADGHAVPDASYSMTFRLYSQATGGTAIWEEIHGNVDVLNGVFSVDLGAVEEFNLPFNQPYWLGIQVGSDPELSPRTKLTSAPYTFQTTWPVGSVIMFAGSMPPPGWLLCDGTAYDPATYPDLHGVIGTNYGSDGGNFKVPDLRGKGPMGFNSGETEFDALGETGGEKTHTLTENEMPGHNHGGSTSSDGGHDHNTGFDDGVGGTGNTNITVSDANCGCGINGWEETDWENDHSHTINSQGGGQAHNNLHPYLTINFIIKY
jgi:microcystin-dependent protein